MSSLQGLRIVVTRAIHQAGELAAPLRALGAEVILLPLIGIGPPLDPEPVRRAVERIDEYDWIIFTSANAVAAFASELNGSPANLRARIGTVGAGTRKAAEQRGFVVSVTPDEYVAESLVAALSTEDMIGHRILIPSAAVTRDVVPRELGMRGAKVDAVEVYRNVVPTEAAEKAALVFREPFPDWVTFASSSAVDNLVRLIGVEPLCRTKIASIGPITSDTVRKHGLTVAAEAKQHSVEGMIAAMWQASWRTSANMTFDAMDP